MGWGNRELTGFGELLQQARAYKGVTLRDAERATRIPRRHLSALENEDFHQLPPLIYARGIVRNYAQYLGLDPVETLAKFEQSHGQRSGGFRVVPAVKTVDVPSHWAPNFAIIAFMVVMSAVIFAWMYSAYFAPPDATPTEEAIETPASDREAAIVGDATPDPSPGVVDNETGSEPSETPPESDEASANEQSGQPTPEGNQESESTESSEDAAGDEGDSEEEASSEDEPTSASDGQHTFVISTEYPVWVQAEVDGEVAFEDVVEPGAPVTLEGGQMTVVSGNASLVYVSVDGEDRGNLGEQWDAATTYP